MVLGNRSNIKINHDNLENFKECTLPELLCLEKWLTILRNSGEYPEKLKDNLALENISITYNNVFNRATLENRIIKFGILPEKVVKDLVSIKPKIGNENYPQSTQGGYRSVTGKVL